MKSLKSKFTKPTRSIEQVQGKKGVLLIHGFTATPQSFHYLLKPLLKADFTVFAPLLDGHGSSIEEFEKTNYEDWYKSVEKAYLKLAKKCDSVIVAGLSMGGLLALRLAYLHPEIKGIALFSTPLFLDSWVIKLLFPLVWKTPLRFLYKYQKKFIASVNDPHEEAAHEAYDKIPLVSVANLLDLQKEVRQKLKFIHQPVLVAHATGDKTVPYENLEYIRACIGSKEVETATLKNSNHVVTVDYDREIVAKRLLKFIKKYS